MTKKKPNWFLSFLKLSLVCFLIIYIALENGYYESKMSEKIAFTETEIRKFEEDIKNKKVVDLNTYNVKEEKNYSNNVSKFGEKFTNSVAKIVTEGTSGLFDVLKTLLW